MKVTIHQPEHLPWLGLFHKINLADVYVILDNVQYRKNYFQNRNKIRVPGGYCWLTVPVKNEFGKHIKDVLIDNSNKRWKKKYWGSIYFSCKKAPFFDKYSEFIKSILEQEWAYICELNIAIITKFLKFLNLNPLIVKASDLGVEGKGAELLLNICRKLEAKVYISGISGREYLNIESFKEAGIEVIFQEFRHPIYQQLYQPFIPCMSITDLLFNYGNKSIEVINGKDVPVMEQIFV
jgi:hypothetical protein